MEGHQTTLVEQLDAEVRSRHLLQHPFYQDWQAGRLGRDALRLYAEQYYRHVEAFPRHLRTLAARAEDPALRALVEENLAEEENPAAPHPQLWRDFAAAVGADGAALDGAAPLDGTRKLVDTYARICREGSMAEAVAALYVYEAQVPEIATEKISGLRQFYGVNDGKGMAYFAVHEEADVRHRAAWREWLAGHDEGDRAGVVRAAEEALGALWGILDAVHQKNSCQ